MSRTLQQLDIGSLVMIKEFGEDVGYILLSKDSYSCQMLRLYPLMAKRMNSTDVAVYTDCEMDQYLCSTEETGFLYRFDSATQSALVNKSISTYTYGDTECSYINRKAYILSYGELFGSAPTALEPDVTVLPALMTYFQNGDPSTVRIGRNQDTSAAVSWWLRSAYSATAFRGVYNGGTANDSNAAGTSSWCRPVLSVASATIVSDPGAGTIHLLPVVGHREVEFRGLTGTSVVRPRKGCVKYTAVGLDNVSVQVCNNYGDPEPVWVDATDGSDIVFENTSKQTENWMIGIKCYGETDRYEPAYFKEPTILVEG